MNETLTFNGINSGTHGVYISGESVFNAPERAVEMVTIPGRNGYLAMDQGRFENINVTYPAFMWADTPAAFATNLSAFRNALLSNVGYQELTDDYHADEYRLAIYKSGLEVDPATYNTAGEFDITFDCKPQRFLYSGLTPQTFTANGTITNPELFASSPLLKVTGTGTVGIGSYSFDLLGSAGQVIYIDCEIMEAWEIVGGGKISRNDYVQYAGNAFPKIEPGAHGVSLDAGITEIEITPRWFRL